MVALPEAEKQHWLARAERALKNYDLPDAQLEWLAYTHNAVFSVQSGDKKYVLRIHKPDAVTPAHLYGELHWLQHLTGAGLTVPYPVNTKSGASAGTITEGNENFAFVLFHHIPGESPDPKTLDTLQMNAIGRFIAEMHLASQDYTPSEDITRPRLDYEGLFGETGIYHPGEALSIFSEAQREVMLASIARVKTVMDETGTNESSFGTIHGDLLLKNILLDDKRVCALDFEYCGWGYYLYDLTPVLWQMKSYGDRYNELEDALWQGYISVPLLTNEQRPALETFIVARQVASLRWLAQNLDNPSVQDVAPMLISQRIHELEGFLATGKLNRQSITL